MASLADLVDPEKLSALRAAVGGSVVADESVTVAVGESGPLEHKDVSTTSAPPQTITGFGGGENLGVVGRPHKCSVKGCEQEAVGEKDGKKVCAEHGDTMHKSDPELEEIEFKGDAPMEHKNDAGTAVIVADDDTGLVRAIVSVTGIRDRVDDIIEPGAYEDTLKSHEPIGVWSHDDKTWVARCEKATELLPGDPFFQTKEFLEARDGKPWPRECGALLVDARFNLETQHGAAAYSDVKFFKGKTGWSIGYRVKKAVRDMRAGVRRIKSLNWFEFSPVMVGAAADSMTLSVKSLSQPVDAAAVPDAPEFDLEVWDAEQIAEYQTKRAAFLDALEEKGTESFRRVRTPEGAAHYGEPIGSIIKPDGPEGPLHGLTKEVSVGRMHAPGGWEVEAINLDGHPKLRVKQHGFLYGHGYFNSPAELAVAGVPVAQLKEWDVDVPILELEEKRGGLKVAQKCKYCDADATKYVLHSEGMAYVPACDDDLEKAKDAAARCTPDGSRDESNIVRVGDLPQRKAVPADVVAMIEQRQNLDLSVEVLDLELKLGRHVRTPEGARVFGKPIGSLITPADEARVRGGGERSHVAAAVSGGSGKHRQQAPDAGQGKGTTKPGEVQQKSPPAPPTAMRARTAAEQARQRAADAKTPEERALAGMEADVLERFARTVDSEDAAAYDKPGADPINFHGGQPTGLRRLLQNHLPKHLKKAEGEAAIAIIGVEGATMLAMAMGAGGNEHMLMGVAVGTHMMIAAATALKAAIKDFRAARVESRQTKGFDPTSVHPDVETQARTLLKSVIGAARDEWQQLVDSGEPMDDDTYNGIINRIVAKVYAEATDTSDEGEGDMAGTKDDAASTAAPAPAQTKTADELYLELKAATLVAGVFAEDEVEEGEPAATEALEVKTRCEGCGSSALLSSGTCALCGLETKAASINMAARHAYAKSGVAMGDGSYPIPDKAHLKSAIRLRGKSKKHSRAEVETHIKKRAAALKATHMLPASMGGGKKDDVGVLDTPEGEVLDGIDREATADEVAAMLTELDAELTEAEVTPPAGEVEVTPPADETTLFDGDTTEVLPVVTDADLDDPSLIADVLNAEAELAEDSLEEPAAEEKAATMTHEPLGTPGGKQNWIDKTGQLPAYIQHIAKDLHEERGMDLSRAIATAISLVRKWAAGGKDVKEDTRAKAAAAVAEFEALRAKNKARMAAKDAGIDLTWFDIADLTEFKLYGHDTEYVLTDALWKTELLSDQLEQKGLRRVKTPEGVQEYHKPIGAIIGGGGAGVADKLADHRGGVLARLHSHGGDGKQPAGEPVHTHANAGPSFADPVVSDADVDRLVAASRSKGYHEDANALEEIRKLPPNKRYARIQMYRHGQWHPEGKPVGSYPEALHHLAGRLEGTKTELDDEYGQLETKTAVDEQLVRLDESELFAARRLALAID